MGTLRADSSADLQEVCRVTSAIFPASDTMKIFIGWDTCNHATLILTSHSLVVLCCIIRTRGTCLPVSTAVFMRDQLFEIGTTVCTSSFRTCTATILFSACFFLLCKQLPQVCASALTRPPLVWRRWKLGDAPRPRRPARRAGTSPTKAT